jgi:hypothetical protein
MVVPTPTPDPAATRAKLKDLELEKLTLEVEELRAPWWRKTSTYLNLLPITLALATLGVGFFTGFFDTEKSLLEIRTTKLQIDEDRLTKSHDSIKTHFARESTSAAQRMADLLQASAQARDSLLHYSRRLLAIQESVAVAPIRAYLAQLADSDASVDPFHPSDDALIVLLKTQGAKARSSLEREAKRYRDEPVIRANLLYVLAIGTHDAVYRDSLLAWMLSVPSAIPADAWGVMGFGKWDSDDIQLFRRRVFPVALDSSLSTDTFHNLFYLLNSLPPAGPDDVGGQPYFDRLVARAARTSLTDTLTTVERKVPTGILFNLAPEAAMVVVARIMADPTTSGDVRGAMMDVLRSYPLRLGIQSFLSSSAFPSTEGADWAGWLAANQDLVSTWSTRFSQP